jgi:hypothetical protein
MLPANESRVKASHRRYVMPGTPRRYVQHPPRKTLSDRNGRTPCLHIHSVCHNEWLQQISLALHVSGTRNSSTCLTSPFIRGASPCNHQEPPYASFYAWLTPSRVALHLGHQRPIHSHAQATANALKRALNTMRAISC